MPTVNLFPDIETAQRWAHMHGASGRPIAVPTLVADAAAMWAPVVIGG